MHSFASVVIHVIAAAGLAPAASFSTVQEKPPAKFFQLADLSAPKSIAQAMLSLDASKSKSSTSFSEFGLGLVQAFDQQGFLQQGVSMSSPLRTISGRPYYQADRAANELAYRLTKMTQVSFATSSSQEKEGPALMAWGVAFPIYDKTNWFGYASERHEFSLLFAVQSDQQPFEFSGIEVADCLTGSIPEWKSGLSVSQVLQKVRARLASYMSLTDSVNVFAIGRGDSAEAPAKALNAYINQGIVQLEAMRQRLEAANDVQITDAILDSNEWVRLFYFENGDNKPTGEEVTGLVGLLNAFVSEPVEATKKRQLEFESKMRKKYWNREKIDFAVGQSFFSEDKSARGFQSTGMHAWLNATVPIAADGQISMLAGRTFDLRTFDSGTMALGSAENAWTLGGRVAFGSDSRSYYAEYVSTETRTGGSADRTAGWKLGAEIKLAEGNWLQLFYDSAKALDGTNKGLLGIGFIHNFATSRELDFKK